MPDPGSQIDREVLSALEPGLLAGDWSAALRETRRLLALHPNEPGVALGIGICQFHRREFIECIEWMDRAEKLTRLARSREPRPLPAMHLFRGLAYAAKRKPAAAKADLAALRSFGPAPIQWDRIVQVLRGDELLRARLAAEESGLG